MLRDTEPIAQFSAEMAQPHAPGRDEQNATSNARKLPSSRPKITVHASRANPKRQGDATRNHRNLLDDRAIQFTALTLQYLADVQRTLTDHDGTRITVGDLLKSPAFEAALPLFGDSSKFAATLHTLNAANAKASPKPRHTTAPGTTSTQRIPAPYLQAAQKRPAIISRLPPPRPDGSHAPIPDDTRLSRSMASRIARTSEHMIGFETMQLLEVQTSAPIASTLHLRQAINEGRYPAPSVIIRGKDARHLYVLGQPKHLKHVQPAYARFRECARRGNRCPPELRADTTVVDLDRHFADDGTAKQFLRNAASELQRLENPLIRWKPKRAFRKRLLEIADHAASALRSRAPRDPVLLAYEHARQTPPSNKRARDTAREPEHPPATPPAQPTQGAETLSPEATTATVPRPHTQQPGDAPRDAVMTTATPTETPTTANTHQ